MAATAPYAFDRRVVRYTPYGEARDFLACRDEEVLYEGPAGTGKSYACLWKLHTAMLKYPGARALIVRKVQADAVASVLVTYQQRVMQTGSFRVDHYGGSTAEPAQFRYPNRSVVLVGGLNHVTKVMSREYDLVYVNEATEVSEDDWEALTTRLRWGVMPYQQIIADCNPAAPSHWLNQRANLGRVTRFGSRHEDNPTLWDHDRGEWTDSGAMYMRKLDNLTGVRYQRLRLGRWVAAEGQVYDAWDDDIHLVDRAALEDRIRWGWYFATVDWGWTNPGVIQVWAVDSDGRIILVAEVYRTLRPVDGWWVPQAKRLAAIYPITEWVCDPSEPQYLAQFEAAGLNVRPAINDILPGITAVQDRLIPAGDGLPRLQVVRDCLLERDEVLVEAKLPHSTVQEIPEYVWAKNTDGITLKDKPVDMHNHGLDALRYAVAHMDLGGVAGAVDPYLASQFALPR